MRRSRSWKGGSERGTSGRGLPHPPEAITDPLPLLGLRATVPANANPTLFDSPIYWLPLPLAAAPDPYVDLKYSH